MAKSSLGKRCSCHRTCTYGNYFHRGKGCRAIKGYFALDIPAIIVEGQRCPECPLSKDSPGCGLSGTTPKIKRRLRPLECAGRPHSSQHFLLYWTRPADLLSPTRLQLDCSENVDEEAVEQWINEDSTLECCEVLSDDDIVYRVTCGSEERRNFEECLESDEENLVSHQKLSHCDALVHTGTLLNYLEQEDESTSAEKMILRNLRSIICRSCK
ncbi:hypothetical protein AVEN_13737-1 [Araneus ventricosus]|uniref:Uncharacterized protein n=1 Tax=Araneus ventricosus TaxID=182803 RepID=A0A4Y2LIZ2_ARAVE|nr:hypothetical protein AVEN_13737-1 [Araneus ventricosus]